MNDELKSVLSYMKQYVENVYEHDSEPMLSYKDLELVLNYIKLLENQVTEYQDEIFARDNNWYDVQD